MNNNADKSFKKKSVDYMNTDWLPLEKLKAQNAKSFDDDLQCLVERCNNYPDIAEFVQALFAGLMADKDSDEYRIADALNNLVYDIWQTDISQSLGSQYGYYGGWLADFNSFVGNCFLDDSYFTITKTGSFHTWEATLSPDGTQNPLALLAAARDNAFFLHKADSLDGADGLRCYAVGMESSGEVERLLKKTSEK